MSEGKPKEKKKIIVKLRNKYRLVILNDDTFEEKLSLKLSRLNVFILTGFLSLFLIGSTILLIAFTPLREYIPGYSSTALKQQVYELDRSSEELQKKFNDYDRYRLNIKYILEGKQMIDFSDTAITDSVVQMELQKGVSRADSQLRQYVEEEERFNISGSSENQGPLRMSFFTPVKGVVTSTFDPTEDHFGVDIVAKKNEVVKSCQNGMVILSEWTTETGYIIIIQHPGDILSVYKHNSALLKSQGQIVKAGEPIAIIGNSGELSTGPHLHFEMWYKGNPMNPQNFISF